MSDSESYDDVSTSNELDRGVTDWAAIDCFFTNGHTWMKEFQFSRSIKKTKCLICAKTYVGCVKQNLKRHLTKKHPTQANFYNVSFKRKRSASDNHDSSLPTPKNGKLSKGEFIRNCVLLAVVNMVAFVLFDSPFFRALTMVHSKAVKIVINCKTIKYFISLTASAVRKLIAAEIKGRLISIKLDPQHVIIGQCSV